MQPEQTRDNKARAWELVCTCPTERPKDARHEGWCQTTVPDVKEVTIPKLAAALDEAEARAEARGRKAQRDEDREAVRTAAIRHKEGEGDYCDTGSDMEWECRGDCKEAARKAIHAALPKTEGESLLSAAKGEGAEIA